MPATGPAIASRDTLLPQLDPVAAAGPRAIEPSLTVLAPRDGDIAPWTDRYFLKTKEVVGRFGDSTVCYAIFMRRPVIFTPRIMVRWLEEVARERGVALQIELNYEEGEWVGAGEPLMYLTGSFFHLVDLETLFLAEAGCTLRCRLQCVRDVHGLAEGGVPRHGCTPLRRHRNGRDDGLRRRSRFGGGQAPDRSHRIYRQCQ